MAISGTLRKDAHYPAPSEIFKKWVSVENDIEVLILREQDAYSLFSFFVVPSDNDPQEDTLFSIDWFQADSLNEVERKLKSYTSNFL